LLLARLPAQVPQNRIHGLYNILAKPFITRHFDKLQQGVVVVLVELLAHKLDLRATDLAHGDILAEKLPFLDGGKQGAAGQRIGNGAGVLAKGQGELKDGCGRRGLRPRFGWRLHLGGQ